MKNNRQLNDRYFRTTSFYVAVFLFSKGMELVNISPTELPGRSEFVFVDIPERETLTRAYNFARENSSEVMVDARKFATAIKVLKEKLYQGFDAHD